MTREAEYLIAAIAAVMQNTPAPQPPSELDWVEITRLAVKHSVGNLFCYAVESIGSVPDFVREKLLEQKKKAILREATQEVELGILRTELTKANIKFLPLKGTILKTLYPKPDMRSMGDIDILFDPSRGETVREIMVGMGYTVEAYDNGVSPDVYWKRPFMNFEMHRELLSRPKEWKPLFSDVWERAERIGDYEYAMTNEEYYVFLMAHLTKHYVGYGTGIRSVLDIWVYRSRTELDETLVAKRFADLGITEFAANIEALAAAWFGDGATNALLEEMADYVASNGTYGERLTAVMAKTTDVDAAKREYFLRRLFLSREKMEYAYPVLKKTPALLPLCWVHRWGKSLLKGKAISRELRILSAVDGEKANSLQAFHKRAGLKDTFFQE